MNDSTVNWDMMKEAASAVAGLDAAAAVDWLRVREDVLGVHLNRETSAVLHMLEKHLGLVMNAAQKSCVDRAIKVTAVTAATAMQAAHHRLWVDFMAETSPRMVTLDPLMAVRRRVLLAKKKGSGSVTQQRLLKRLENLNGVPAKKDDQPALMGRVRVTRCVAGYEDNAEQTRVVVLITAKSDGSPARNAMYVSEAVHLLKDLTNALAQQGEPLARSTWAQICGSDPDRDKPAGMA